MIVVLKHSRTFPRQEKWWPWTSGWILCMFLSWHLQMFLIRLFSAEKRLKSLRSRRISHLCFSGKAYSQRKCVNGDNSPFFGGWNEFRERSIYFSESRSSAAPQDASGCCSFSPDNGSAVQKYLEFFLSFSTVQSLKFTKKIPKRQHFLGMTEWLAPNKKQLIHHHPLSQNSTWSLWFYLLSHTTEKFQLILQWQIGFLYP